MAMYELDCCSTLRAQQTPSFFLSYRTCIRPSIKRDNGSPHRGAHTKRHPSPTVKDTTQKRYNGEMLGNEMLSKTTKYKKSNRRFKNREYSPYAGSPGFLQPKNNVGANETDLYNQHQQSTTLYPAHGPYQGGSDQMHYQTPPTYRYESPGQHHATTTDLQYHPACQDSEEEEKFEYFNAWRSRVHQVTYTGR